jgi:tight adherence protein B
MEFTFIAFMIFTGALLAAGYYAWTVPQRQAGQVLGARLREVRARGGVRRGGGTPDLIRHESQGTFGFLNDFASWIGPLRRLQEFISQANLRHKAHDVLAISIIAAAAVFFLVGVLGITMLLLRLIIAVLIGALPTAYILRVRAKRLRKFEENLPDAIDLFNRSMKAGHNIHAGLETIAAETADPVRMEFKKAIEELALGSQLEAALHNLGKRVPLIDLKFFITSLILQRQTGANMVQVLDNLSLLVRERLNLAAKMKAATAQQRFSAGLLCAMPLVVGLGFWIVKPEYIRLLYTHPTGSKFLTYAIISEIVGILIIRKIASPKF